MPSPVTGYVDPRCWCHMYTYRDVYPTLEDEARIVGCDGWHHFETLYEVTLLTPDELEDFTPTDLHALYPEASEALEALGLKVAGTG